MLGFDLTFTRDEITLSCRSCGEDEHVDRTHTADVVASATLRFCDRHVPCRGDAARAIPAPRAAAGDVPAGRGVSQ